MLNLLNLDPTILADLDRPDRAGRYQGWLDDGTHATLATLGRGEGAQRAAFEGRWIGGLGLAVAAR